MVPFEPYIYNHVACLDDSLERVRGGPHYPITCHVLRMHMHAHVECAHVEQFGVLLIFTLVLPEVRLRRIYYILIFLAAPR